MTFKKKPVLLFFSAAVPFFILYFLTLSQNFTFDAIINALASETNEPLRWFHPNHLLFPSLGAFWFRVEKIFGYSGFSVYSLARLNIGLMAISMGLLFVFLAKEIEIKKAAAVTGFVGVTYAFWHYASDGIGYAPFVLMALLLIGTLLHLSKKKNFSQTSNGFLIVLSTLYVMAHAISIFHIAGVAVWMWFHIRNKKKRIKAVGTYLGGTLGSILLVYVLVFYLLGNNESSTFVSWGLGYAGHKGTAQALQSPFWYFEPIAILDGFWFGWVTSFFHVSSNSPLFLKVGAQAVGVITLIVAVLGIRQALKEKGKTRKVTLGLLVWAGLTMLFLLPWSPGQTGYRLHVLVPLLFVLSFQLKSLRKPHSFIALGAVVLFTLNIYGRIGHDMDLRNNRGLYVMTQLNDQVKPGDIVLSLNETSLPQIETIRPYFFPHIKGGTLTGWLLVFKETSVDPLRKQLTRSFKQGIPVYLSDDFFSKELQVRVEQKNGLKPGSIQEFLSIFEVKPAFTLLNGALIYKVHNVNENHIHT